MGGAAQRAGGLLRDAVLPPRCLVSGEIVAKPGQLAASAWGAVNFITAPLCAACGFPFPYDAGEPEDAAAMLCGACIAGPPAYDRARAVFQYDDASRGMILAFKHADRLEGADAYAAWMARAGAQLLLDADLIAPVPLHRFRLWRRRYNQAAVLALALGRLSGVPVEAGLLARVRNTPAMVDMNIAQRRRNLQGAIMLRPRYTNRLAGCKLLLIDDVLTSGATAEACARAAKSAGAARVDVLTLARVVRSAAGAI